jgi:lipopolysaccharide transport system ATP-binding protein
MNDALVKVENVSKKFCRSLKRSLWYGITDLGNELLGHSHDNDGKLRKDEFWAVNDVSFELKRGECLGLIGPNGAGKTTLLRMLNGLIKPDRGRIEMHGRVGALIALGAGFNPILTGRENIYVNASVLGIKKKEIESKFDEIVDFAELDEFIDTPVQSYSSGMNVRLGFSIAIALKPDILLLDEVLAVGDGVFQTKCYRKLNEIKKKENIAIILISHSLLAIEKFCNTGILLNKGTIKNHGEIHNVIRNYQSKVNQLLNKQNRLKEFTPGIPHCTKEIEITDVKFTNVEDKEQDEFSPGSTLGIKINLKTNQTILNPIFQIALLNQEGVFISVLGTHINKIQIEPIHIKDTVRCMIDNLPLLCNKYYITIAIYDETHNITLDYWNGAINAQYFRVLPDRTSEKMGEFTPICQMPTRWIFGNGE